MKNISKGTDNVPIAMFVGAEDKLADPTDATWAKDQIGEDVVVHFEIIPEFSHSAFTMGIDMSYMSRVMDLIVKYNGSATQDD
jgi:dienelactone hydrolase